MMKIFEGSLSKDIMKLFYSPGGPDNFFSYTLNYVTLEQALAVIGILSPDFIEVEGCILWVPNASEPNDPDYFLYGLKKTITGDLVQSNERKDRERYHNNLTVNHLFLRWADNPDEKGIAFNLGKEDYTLCHHFAEQIVRYWRIALLDKFPDKTFEFEVADEILDEDGVCLTFWQSDDSV